MDKKFHKKNTIPSEEIQKNVVEKFGGRFEGGACCTGQIGCGLGYYPTKGVGQEKLRDSDKENHVGYCKKHMKYQFSNAIWIDETLQQLY